MEGGEGVTDMQLQFTSSVLFLGCKFGWKFTLVYLVKLLSYGIENKPLSVVMKLWIESLAHDSGRTLVRAEYGYPKGSPNTNS
jgi:hypothetical protein